MVSKVAVIALVGILAIPILIGYGMNLDQVTETKYEPVNDQVNVTALLQSATQVDTYTYTHGDPYLLNTQFSALGGGNLNDYPIFEKVTNNKTSTPLFQKYTHTLETPRYTETFATLGDIFLAMEVSNGYSTGDRVAIAIRDPSNNAVLFESNLRSFYFDYKTMAFNYTAYVSDSSYMVRSEYIVPALNYKLEVYALGTPEVYTWVSSSSLSTFSDLSAGYHFFGSVGQGNTNMPQYTRNALMTVNLDSITDSNYSTYLASTGIRYIFDKTTTNGVVSWTVTNNDNPTEVFNLYYDPNRNDNTYQIYFDLKTTNQDDDWYYYKSHVEFRYVGGWPTSFGAANTFLTYTSEREFRYSTMYPEYHISYVGFTGSSNHITPTYRVDDAEFRGYIVQAIRDITYKPSDFRNNPATTIKDPALFGQSIEFGGNTYNVTDGNITLGTHEFSIRNMVFDSIPSAGGYDNRINGMVVSTTAQPSDIRFNGAWLVTVSTTSMQSSTYTKTEWTPGEFGWDGVDDNFLIVGLLTSIGAFIALGFYVRRTGSSLWPLLVVCGGAILLFFTML